MLERGKDKKNTTRVHISAAGVNRLKGVEPHLLSTESRHRHREHTANHVSRPKRALYDTSPTCTLHAPA